MYTLMTSLTGDVRTFSTEENAKQAFDKACDKIKTRDVSGFVVVRCGKREVCSFYVFE